MHRDEMNRRVRPARAFRPWFAVGLTLALLLVSCGGEEGDDATADGGDAASGTSDETDGAASGEDAAAGEEWPTEAIRVVAPTPPGGSFDINSRQIAPYLEEQLGVPVNVENVEGGGYTIGTNVVAQAANCETLLVNGYPILQVSELTFDTDWGWEDFPPLAGLWLEPPIVRVNNDAPWQTFAELVADAQERPGEISASLNALTSGQSMMLYYLEDELGVDFNLVPYEGGGPSRTALLQGEVDFTVPGVFNSLAVADETRVIGVHTDTGIDFGELVDNSEEISEQLDVELPPGFDQILGLYVHRSCAEEHPERYETLVEAVATAIEDEGYLADLEQTGDAEKLIYQSPEEHTAYGQDVVPVMEDMLQRIEGAE